MITTKQLADLMETVVPGLGARLAALPDSPSEPVSSATSATTSAARCDLPATPDGFMAVAREVCPAFVVDDANRRAIRAVYQWCNLDTSGPLDPGLGLWLVGDVGTGKSTLLRIVHEYCRRAVRGRDEHRPYGRVIPYGFGFYNTCSVSMAYQERGFEGLDPYVTGDRIAFDELGREPLRTGNYGTSINVMEYVLQRRYDLARPQHFTHVTTNFGDREIVEKYNPHIYDRCRQMFNFVNLRGASRRG